MTIETRMSLAVNESWDRRW